MKTASIGKKKRRKASRAWIWIGVAVILIAGGLGYFFWKQQAVQAQETVSDEMQTTRARRGDLTLSVLGSGTLDAGQESNLAFSASGVVDEVNVEVGDQVKEGDALAVLSNLSELQDDINAAQLDLNSAQEALDSLEHNSSLNLANARLAVVNAQKELDDAKSGIVQEGWQRCDQKTLDAYYAIYLNAKDYLDKLGDGGGDSNYYKTTVLPQKNIVAAAKENYEYCLGYTDYEITASEATIMVAEANLEEAQDTLDTLIENKGIDPIELATTENKVSSAQLKLDTAKEALEGATLTAPFDGTILAVASSAGDSVGMETFITIADLANPVVNFSVDETDMNKISVGQSAEVVFDALPDQIYIGNVIRIDPSLTTSGNYKIATGVIRLDLSQTSGSSNANDRLLKGLTGTVILVQSSTADALLVPIQALRNLGDGSYAVFVVGANDQPRLTLVEVGLMDDTYVEITSGLEEGAVVTTGTANTSY